MGWGRGLRIPEVDAVGRSHGVAASGLVGGDPVLCAEV